MQSTDQNILKQSITFGRYGIRHQVQAKDEALPPGIAVRQVHGDQIFEPEADYAQDHHTSFQPEGGFDAILWWHSSPRVLHIKTADCLPLVITAIQGEAYAVVHAGWRGLAANIISKTLQRFYELGIKIQDLRIYIGPAICQDHYEVGEELLAAFAQKPYAEALKKHCFRDCQHAGKYLFDLKAAAVQELLFSKVGPEQILVSPVCTFSEKQIPSYRRDQATGRLLTSVWRTSNS